MVLQAVRYRATTALAYPVLAGIVDNWKNGKRATLYLWEKSTLNVG